MLEAGWVSLLAYVPLALRAYWALAAGAALLALSPVRLAPAFRRGRSTPGAAAQRLLGSPGRALEVKAVSDLARPGRDLGLRARGGRAAVVLSACRGKTWDAKPAAALGPLTGLSVPQSWFAHFYDVGAAANAAVLAGLLALTAAPAARPRPPGPALPGGADAALAALGLLQLHLCRRLAEANWLARYPPGARMHVIAYAFGLSYYVVLPLSLLPDGAWRQLAARAWPAGAPAASAALARARAAALALPPLGLLGAAVFLAGNALQLHSHWLLARLRPARPAAARDPAAAPDPDAGRGAAAAGGYRLPRGGAFELVSCPHYLAEIVIYAGLALVAGRGRLLPWLVLAWVVANLLLAAGPTHSWYRRHFKDYPARRRAIIPFVY